MYENQFSTNLRNIAEKIPYRTSRLTHLFKSFFEGSGSIRMLICLNPMSEYAELLVNIKTDNLLIYKLILIICIYKACTAIW